ncbi:MAG: helix-turn-helix transcriptional regulator [Thomasclavelia ramosa]|mgnify:CR=1 FL=1|nr:helix-turn-helix transcriptional regulator [Thomasclavelia ramosa]
MMFNDNLNKYRKQKGLSQEELAFRLGVSRQSVSGNQVNLHLN